MKRRLFLKGALGATLGLPFLESLSGGDAQAAPGDKRFIAFFCCNGFNQSTFFPASYGAINSTALMSTSLAPVSSFADRLLIPRGLHKTPRGYGQEQTVGDDHANGMAGKLTAQRCGNDTYAQGISLDQYIANALNEPGTPALTLLVGGKSNSVLGHISYSGPGQPVTGENNPALAYQDLVGLGNLDDEQLQRLLARRESVLDLVEDEYEYLLSQKLSKADRDKLDMHFTAVRDLEIGMSGAIACMLDPAREAEILGVDGGSVSLDANFKMIGRMQMDILALAIACGATRAATIQWGSGAGGPRFSWDGMNHSYNHHKLSHGTTEDGDCTNCDVPGYEQMISDIDTWYVGEYAYLLEKLDAYTELDGSTALDNSAVVYMNELGDGKGHTYTDLPYVIAGSCGGYLKTGEYINMGNSGNTNSTDAPHNKLLCTLANAVGVTENGGPVQSFGDMTTDSSQPGEYSQLKA
jgi:hypothetical protein